MFRTILALTIQAFHDFVFHIMTATPQTHLFSNELTSCRNQSPQPPRTVVTSATSGKTADFWKNDEKNRFLFLDLRVDPKATSVD